MHAGYETVCKENVLILSDFNAISCSSEKQGGRQFDFSSCNRFYQLKLMLGLVDIGQSGNPFTWCNSRKGYNQIREHLDKGVANGEWSLLFPRAIVQHLP